MGCGKTTVGKQLAKITSMEYIDIDQYIEKQQNTTISEIFANHGESYFRELEHKACKELSAKRGCIISAGGGTLLFDRNIEALKENSTILLLDVPLSTIKHRLRNDKKRPLLQRPDKERVMEEMYNARLPLYKKATAKIINANNSPLAVAEEIKALLKKQQL